MVFKLAPNPQSSSWKGVAHDRVRFDSAGLTERPEYYTFEHYSTDQHPHGGAAMLILSRREKERIRLGDSIVVTVIRVAGDKVRLGIEAPADVLVLRDELEPYTSRPDRSDSSRNNSDRSGNERSGKDSEANDRDPNVRRLTDPSPLAKTA